MTETPDSTSARPRGGEEEAASTPDPAAAEGAPAAEEGAAAGDALAELTNRYTRLAADFDNFRKRTAREQAERFRYAAESSARALLPVLDNLRRAVEAAPADTPEGLLDGLAHTVRQFEEALASVGVSHIEAVGAPFDPALHEAVMGEESEDVDVDTVVAELQRGYRIADRVLRPTMVKVAHPVHVAVPGGRVPATGQPPRPPANGGVHHDLPAAGEPDPDTLAGPDGWIEA